MGGVNINPRGTREHNSWRGARDRCTNPNAANYARYGGRGITMCQRWLDSFEAFLADMGKCPPGHTLERKDNSGPYAPDNCRWALPTEQQLNRRRIDLTDMRFGRLLVLGRADRARYWRCRCDCGKEKEFYDSNLRAGLTTSCNCLRSAIHSARLSEDTARLSALVAEHDAAIAAIAEGLQLTPHR